jgi:surface antigen
MAVNRRSLKTRAGAAAGTLLAATVLGLAGAGHASAYTPDTDGDAYNSSYGYWNIQNTDSAGLYEHGSPNIDSPITGALPNGTAIEAICQVNGTTDHFDGLGYTVWDKLDNGNYIYDGKFVSSPGDGFHIVLHDCNTGSSSLNPGNYPWSVGPNTYISDGHGYYQGECVSFAAWAIRSDGRPHSKSPDFLGNANQWTGAYTDPTPQVGDIAQWDPNVHGAGGAGHVAYVAAVNGDGTITVDEYNWLDSYDGYVGHRLSVRTNIQASDPSRYLHF